MIYPKNPSIKKYNDYGSFLEDKKNKTEMYGFDPVFMPDYLLDFQKFLLEWAIRKGRAAIFSDCGCVSGETVIQGPNGDKTIKELAEIGEPIKVWSLNSSGYSVSAHATCPFWKGKAELWEFRLSSGKSITVTDDHLFLTPLGWSYAGKISVGSRIAVDRFPSFSHNPLPSTEEPYQSALLLGVLNSSKTTSSYSDGCFSCYHQHDEQPLSGPNIGQGVFPPQDDVPEYIHESLHRDVLAYESKYNRLRRPWSPPSKKDYPNRLETSNEIVLEYQDDSLNSKHRHSFSQWILQFLAHEFPLLPFLGFSESFPCRMLMGDLFSQKKPPLYDFVFDTVISINYITKGDYFDLHVPGFENYLANGVWNHNTGKTIMQLVFAENVVRKTNKPVLILTPLSVSHQTKREGDKFGIECYRSVRGEKRGKIIISNYERLHFFNPSDFEMVVCDESSCIKNFEGKRQGQIKEFMKKTPFRLLCTATAAPNDYIELLTSSETLGEMGRMDALSTFFKNDENSNHPIWWGARWRFKQHAEKIFWRWVCSWARAMRKPSDYGFYDGDFILPDLIIKESIVENTRPFDGYLFPIEAITMKDQQLERKNTVNERCEKVAELVDHDRPAVVWCHYNPEGDLLQKIIPGSKQVKGSQKDEEKESIFDDFSSGNLRVLITKPKIGAFGMNWQHCNHTTFFPSHSFEQTYQGIRRFWRFGQTQDVTVDIITTKGELGVLKNLKRKAEAAEKLFDMLIFSMNNSLQIEKRVIDTEMEVPSWLKA
jgi:hypothetical protein